MLERKEIYKLQLNEYDDGALAQIKYFAGVDHTFTLNEEEKTMIVDAVRYVQRNTQFDLEKNSFTVVDDSVKKARDYVDLYLDKVDAHLDAIEKEKQRAIAEKDKFYKVTLPKMLADNELNTITQNFMDALNKIADASPDPTNHHRFDITAREIMKANHQIRIIMSSWASL